jgi:hypothetical protein
MYNLRYSNPRLSGNIIRAKRKCGKANCRCSQSKKYLHPYYYLEYKELVNGRWKRKREYVSKSKVRALRAKIKRAKQKENRDKKILKQVPLIAKKLAHNPFDFNTLREVQEVTDKMLKIKPQSLKQLMQVTSGMIDIVAGIIKPKMNHNHEPVISLIE